MARFYIEATWRSDGVAVEMDRVEPLTPERVQRMIERGVLRTEDDRLVRRRVGELTVPYPDGGFPKRVRRAALDWLAEHAGMTEADSFELQMATDDARQVLARLEALVSAG
jgi:hypothetical protein